MHSYRCLVSSLLWQFAMIPRPSAARYWIELQPTVVDYSVTISADTFKQLESTETKHDNGMCKALDFKWSNNQELQKMARPYQWSKCFQITYRIEIYEIKCPRSNAYGLLWWTRMTLNRRIGLVYIQKPWQGLHDEPSLHVIAQIWINSSGWILFHNIVKITTLAKRTSSFPQCQQDCEPIITFGFKSNTCTPLENVHGGSCHFGAHGSIVARDDHQFCSFSFAHKPQNGLWTSVYI